METIVSDQPAPTAWADLKRHFTQKSEKPFSRVSSHILYIIIKLHYLEDIPEDV